MSVGPSFSWRFVNSKQFGIVSIPVAYIEMKSKSEEWKIFYPVIDTGAVVSVFSVNDCERLGYNLEDGEPFELRGGLGGVYPSYVHRIELRIGKKRLESRVAFTVAAHNKQYLGLIDIFDKFDIYFTKNERTHFN